MASWFGAIYFNLVHFCLEEVEHTVRSFGVEHNLVPQFLVEVGGRPCQLQQVVMVDMQLAFQ